MVLVVLAIIWVAVLVPPAIRARAEARPADSIGAFRRQLTVLRRARPQWGGRGTGEAWPTESYVPSAVVDLHRRQVAGSATNPLSGVARLHQPSFRAASARSRTLRRRRDVLVVLLASAGVTLLLALMGVGMMLVLHLLVDVLLAGYIALLVRQRNLAAERELKVRFLPRRQAVEPAYLRRSVN